MYKTCSHVRNYNILGRGEEYLEWWGEFQHHLSYDGQMCYNGSKHLIERKHSAASETMPIQKHNKTSKTNPITETCCRHPPFCCVDVVFSFQVVCFGFCIVSVFAACLLFMNLFCFGFLQHISVTGFVFSCVASCLTLQHVSPHGNILGRCSEFFIVVHGTWAVVFKCSICRKQKTHWL